MPARELVTPRRYDLAVKWRMFRHFMNGDDEDSERVYLWHMRERQGAWAPADIYLIRARSLFASMSANGFDSRYPVPVDPNGELLDGGHRTSCALALDISAHVRHHDQHVWAPDWGLNWFKDHKCPTGDFERIEADFSVIS